MLKKQVLYLFLYHKVKKIGLIKVKQNLRLFLLCVVVNYGCVSEHLNFFIFMSCLIGMYNKFKKSNIVINRRNKYINKKFNFKNNIKLRYNKTVDCSNNSKVNKYIVSYANIRYLLRNVLKKCISSRLNSFFNGLFFFCNNKNIFFNKLLCKSNKK